LAKTKVTVIEYQKSNGNTNWEMKKGMKQKALITGSWNQIKYTHNEETNIDLSFFYCLLHPTEL
jgi:hypothetical protein